jgi:YesN/AraC family two-component response regulator
VKAKHRLSSDPGIINNRDKEKNKLLTFLADNYSRPDLDIQILQKETGFGEKKITALLKKETGLSFKPYLNHLRIKKAKHFLLHTDWQITEIAFKVGYNNVSHFNRVFKEQNNMTPGLFRKKYK